MDQQIQNKIELKNSLINFYDKNKFKIYSLIIILVTVFAFFLFIKNNNEKKNILVAEKYVEAGIYLSSNKIEEAKNIYKEIIFSKNKFYSMLSLNTLVEKNLISDESEILNYFKILEKILSNEEQADLAVLKKALYMIKESDTQSGMKMLQKLSNKNTIFKPIAEDILKK